MKRKKFFIFAALALLMQGVVSNNVWADGDDPIPFIILPPEGEGGDIPPLPGGPGNDGGDGGHAGPKSPVQMPTVVQDGHTLDAARWNYTRERG